MQTQTALKVGGVYKMNHQRKGKATVKILEIGDPWIQVVLVDGSVKGIGAGSYRETGDELAVRDSLATFTAVDEGCEICAGKADPSAPLAETV